MADADNRYLDLNFTTGKKELRKPITSSVGAADGGKIVALNTTTGKWDPSLIPNVTSFSVIAFEAIAAGQFVHLFDNAGTINMRLADAGAGLEAHGFVLTAVAALASETFETLTQKNTAVAGLTVGARYYLDPANAGDAVTAALTIASTEIYQFVGVATSATEILTYFDDAIVVL